MIDEQDMEFYACRPCFENGCEPSPESDQTQFTRTWYSSSIGSSSIELDSDGDISETSPDGWDESGEEEPQEYISCQCCGHEIYVPSVNIGSYHGVRENDKIVHLWWRESKGKAYTYEHAEELGWTSDDEEDEEDYEDEATVSPASVPFKSDGRFLNGAVTNLAEQIANVAQDAAPIRPDVKPEIEIVITT